MTTVDKGQRGQTVLLHMYVQYMLIKIYSPVVFTSLARGGGTLRQAQMEHIHCDPTIMGSLNPHVRLAALMACGIELCSTVRMYLIACTVYCILYTYVLVVRTYVCVYCMYVPNSMYCILYTVYVRTGSSYVCVCVRMYICVCHSIGSCCH